MSVQETLEEKAQQLRQLAETRRKALWADPELLAWTTELLEDLVKAVAELEKKIEGLRSHFQPIR